MKDAEFSIAIMRNGGIGIGAGALDRPDRPLLAVRIAKDTERVRRTWDAAAPADREAFWNWLFPESE